MPVKKTESAKSTVELEKKVAALESKLALLVAKLEQHEKESKKGQEDLRAMCVECCKPKSSGTEDKECREAVKSIAKSLMNPRAAMPDVSGL